jgi:hypothetical protein
LPIGPHIAAGASGFGQSTPESTWCVVSAAVPLRCSSAMCSATAEVSRPCHAASASCCAWPINWRRRAWPRMISA